MDARRERILLLALIVVLIVGVFARTLGHDFLTWDDDRAFTSNAWLNPPTFAGLVRMWRAPFQGLYVPMSQTLFWLECLPFGRPVPWVFHLVSIALHAACALSVVALLERLGAGTRAACVGALVFALHPIQVESVAWANEQRGLLAIFLGILALFLFTDEQRTTRTAVIASVLVAAALLAKPAAAALPLVATALEVFVLRRGLARALAWIAPWFVLALLVAWISKVEQSDANLAYVPALVDRPLIALDALGTYFGLMRAPLDLGPDHGRAAQVVLTDHAWVPHALGAVGIVLVAVILLVRGRPSFASAVALTTCAVAPVLGLVPFAYQDISTTAERYAYLAMLGPAFLAARVIDHYEGRGPARAWKLVFVAVPLAWLAGTSFRQVGFWRDTETLFTHTLAVNPKSWIAHTNLGLMLQARGDRAGAAAHYEAAIAASPAEEARALNNLGMLRAEAGRRDEAEALLIRAANADENYSRPYQNLAALRAQQGRMSEAEQFARRAVLVTPFDADAAAMLAQVFSAEGKHGDALDACEAYLRVAPPTVSVLQRRAQAAIGAHRRDLADASYASAIELARRGDPARAAALSAERDAALSATPTEARH